MFEGHTETNISLIKLLKMLVPKIDSIHGFIPLVEKKAFKVSFCMTAETEIYFKNLS